MKPSYSLFFAGLLITALSASAVEFLPPDATLEQWIWLLALTVVGVLAVFIGANDIRNEQSESNSDV